MIISLDSNLLFYAFQQDSPWHGRAFAFIESLQKSTDVILSEFSLVEFYRLLRNAVVIKKPLTAPDAVRVIESYRAHPRWRVTHFPEGKSATLSEQLWRLAAQPGFAYRRIYDARLALVLLAHGVTDFATANTKDFEGFGFKRVWNPLEET